MWIGLTPNGSKFRNPATTPLRDIRCRKFVVPGKSRSKVDQISTRRPASADRTARVANFRRDLEATEDFNWWLPGKPASGCMFAVIKMESSSKTVYGPVLKTTQLSAHAQNHASPERCRKSFTMIFLGDHDIPLTGSKFANLTTFRAICSHIFTAHAWERPLMNFRLKFWHHHSIPWYRFRYRARYFGDTRTFSVDFCIG